MKILFLVLVTIAAFFEGFADILLKKWSLGVNRGFYMAAGLFVYLISTLVWAYSLKFEGISKAISVVTALNLLFVVLVGVFYFKEQLSWVNILGIALVLVSIFLIER